MIETLLQLRFASQMSSEPAAFYLAGKEASVWLDEIAKWNAPHSSIRLLPIASSAADRSPRGVLIYALQNSATSWGASKSCLTYRRIGERLFLPADGCIEPSVSDQEIDALLAADYTYVWHPVAGLVAFEASDVLSVSDLIRFEVPRAREWNLARPGVVLAQQLTALFAAVTPTVDDIMNEGQDDIGTDSSPLSELPPSPAEPDGGILNSAARQGKRMLANISQWITRQVPHTGSRETWVNRLEDWAERQLNSYASGLDAARNKEIERLMHMLESDPDRGLRHALPLSGDAHRGNAPPGVRLGERIPDFSLGRLGGGGAADQWELSYEHHMRLTARYRELANRELQLGRHRRAAFTFAELLGDFYAAAGALTQGRHWREAAVLYQKRLSRPLESARCLEQGGLWTEAIELYEELGEHEKAGDLHAKLEQVESANEQYRLAIEKQLRAGDHVAAAKLLEVKLGEIDKAIETLASGWPDSAQSSRCLDELFDLFARTGRHEATHRWIERFRETPQPNELALTEILADTAAGYSDESVQYAAADCTRVIVSRQLDEGSSHNKTRLLGTLARLEPKDRLLGRDCRRFQSKSAAKTEPAKRRNRDLNRPNLIHSVRFPHKGVIWTNAIGSGEAIYAVGHCDNDYVLARCSWTKFGGTGRIWKASPRIPVTLTASPLNDDFVFVHVFGQEHLTGEMFTPSDVCRTHTRFGVVRDMPPYVYCAVRAAHRITWLLNASDTGLVLTAVNSAGELVTTQAVDVPDAEFDEDDLIEGQKIYAHGDRVYLAFGDLLQTYMRGRPVETTEFPSPIQSLTGSAPNTRTRIVATFQRGAAMFFDDGNNDQITRFASDMEDPVACVNRGGFLVIACKGEAQVYSTSERTIRLVGEFSIDQVKPVAVIPGMTASRFGIVYESGKVDVFELPK